MVGAEQGASRGKPKSLCLVLSKETDRGERAQEAIEQDRIGADRVGDALSRGIVVWCQMVEDPERRAGVKDLAAPSAENEVDNIVGGIRHSRQPPSSPFLILNYDSIRDFSETTFPVIGLGRCGVARIKSRLPRQI